MTPPHEVAEQGRLARRQRPSGGLSGLVILLGMLGLLAATALLLAGPGQGWLRGFGLGGADQPAGPAAVAPPPAPADALPIGDGVPITPQDDAQSVVDAHGPGSRFTISGGLHRGFSVIARDGDVFEGDPGAILSGAVLLAAADFDERDGLWVIGGQEAEGDVREPRMLIGRERDAIPEELFWDGLRLQHADTPSDVDGDSWYFDHDADEVWVGRDPRGADTIELSVEPYAFAGPDVADVTIVDVEVRNYASPAQGGAIDGTDSLGWRVDRVAAVDNHATGIRIGPGMHLSRCLARGNGQLGVAGAGFNHRTEERVPFRVTSCVVESNHVLGFDWHWEAGGMKFAITEGAVVANNIVRDHPSPGIWFDIDARDTRVCANLVERNLMGIFIEISTGAVVDRNIVRDSLGGPSAVDNSAFFISESADVVVRDNVASGVVVGVRGSQIERDDTDVVIRGLRVLDNDLSFTDWSGLQVSNGDEGAFLPGAQDFQGNTYRTDADRPFRWDGQELDLAAWQALGFDTGGDLVAPGAPVPLDLEGFHEPTPVGPHAEGAEPAAASCDNRQP